ncbi:MAG TPA: type II toxin-antitoxin system prevent-host-death family antitoxin [Terriglobia bacterium]|nr:type II toxin-antitoxin system prevent-host-death family antitoxin [Terriglobia bacterium]
MKMGLREANQNFSKAIRHIKSGRVIILTERGKPIATITPIERPGDRDELQALRDEGFLIGRREPGLLRTGSAPVSIQGRAAISTILRSERDED